MSETENQNPLGMRSIKEVTTLGLAEDYRNRIFSMDWIFNKFYEKLILVVCFSWTVYSFLKYLSGFF